MVSIWTSLWACFMDFLLITVTVNIWLMAKKYFASLSSISMQSTAVRKRVAWLHAYQSDQEALIYSSRELSPRREGKRRKSGKMKTKKEKNREKVETRVLRPLGWRSGRDGGRVEGGGGRPNSTVIGRELRKFGFD